MIWEKIFVWENLKLSIERISIYNGIKKLVEHGMHCLPCSSTNDIIDLLPKQLWNYQLVRDSTIAEWCVDDIIFDILVAVKTDQWCHLYRSMADSVCHAQPIFLWHYKQKSFQQKLKIFSNNCYQVI